MQNGIEKDAISTIGKYNNQVKKALDNIQKTIEI